ncbi:hypothetical protein C7T35_28600 [Variovorax sp. WS11]|uniref:hypothetical protein n=1 Tax=Variovorax sp. WS11 TaxID=1105204 RepID=UPI000D0DA907|nr:hypothetical protein [Variovorax sp. WS11]NDZ13567.1 hypothetical protein [Variovorax sp. WS11]PSL81136.1 hypothetical protein C7T35_28600 [Variovorax sp. WS11]
MDTEEQRSFLHRGRRVTISHWTDAGKIYVRAEIHQGNTLVCVLSRSGIVERAPRLIAGLHNAAIKWAEHDAAVSKRPGQPWPLRPGFTTRPAPR